MRGPVLIGCEESQVLCGAFRAAGFEAYSCDLKPTRGNQAWHRQADVMDVLASQRWRLVVLHPDCTAMALSGNRHYGFGKPRAHKRAEAVAWTTQLWKLAKQQADMAALENPESVIFHFLGAPRYNVYPFEHGHGERKKTVFAVHNLPPLWPTNQVEGREQRIYNMSTSFDRKRNRSETFPGIAAAIVSQWGKFV